MRTFIILIMASMFKPLGCMFANDYTGYVLEILSGVLPALRNQFALAARIYNHGSVRGIARWTKIGAGIVETKNEGTQLTGVTSQTNTKVDLLPATHKLTRFHIEDGEMSVSSVKSMAAQNVPYRVKLLVNTIETAIAAKQSSLITNRIGTLGAGISRERLAEAVRLLEVQDGMPETLVVHPSVKKQMKTDDDIQKMSYFTRNTLPGGSFVPNFFEFRVAGRSNQIYSPDTNHYVCLAFQREWCGIAFGNLSGVDAGAGRFIKSITDPITGITFRVIQKATADGLGQEFLIDCQYDIEVQEEQLCVAISC